jgi:hypothetical protein
MVAPDHSAYCIPVGPSPAANWTNATVVTCPNPKFDPDLAPVLTPTGAFAQGIPLDIGIFPQVFTKCMPMATWTSFSPSNTANSLVTLNGTALSQLIQTFIWLANKSDKFYTNGRAVPLKGYLTVNGMHIPPNFCQISLGYVDFYAYIIKCFLFLTKITSSGTSGIIMTPDIVGNYYLYCEQLFRTKVYESGQIEHGLGFGSVYGKVSPMNFIAGRGALLGSVPIMIKALLDQIGIVKVASEWIIPQLNVNYGSSLYNGSAWAGLPQFPFYNTGSQYFNGNITSGSGGIPGNAIVWYPYTQADNPMSGSTVNNGLNIWSGASGTSATVPGTAGIDLGRLFAPGITLTADQALFNAYVGLPAITGMNVQIIGAFAQFAAIADAFNSLFALGTIGFKDTRLAPNVTKLGGPGMYSYCVNVPLQPQNSYVQCKYLQLNNAGNIPTTNTGAYVIDYVFAAFHTIFSCSRVESAGVLLPSDMAMVLFAGLRGIYRLDGTPYVYTSYTSAQLSAVNVTRVFNQFMAEFSTTGSAALEMIAEDEKSKHTKKDDTLVVTQKSIDLEKRDCLRRAFKTVARLAANLLVRPEAPDYGRAACKGALYLSATVGVPIPGGAIACNAVGKAIKFAGTIAQHYKDKQ